jgi:hypothetical protein
MGLRKVKAIAGEVYAGTCGEGTCKTLGIPVKASPVILKNFLQTRAISINPREDWLQGATYL